MPSNSMPSALTSALAISLSAQNEIVKSNKRLDDAVENSIKQGLPHSIAVSPSHGKFLSLLCKLLNAKSVLEIGVLGGFSTIWLAASVPGIHVTGIEFNAKHRKVAVENVKGMDNVDIIEGAALDILPKLAKERREFDFVFIDANWDEQSQYFDWAVKMTRKGGAVYVDNAVRQLTESEEGDEAAHALIDHVKADERVDATLIPTLNTHKKTLGEVVDGFLLAIVK